VNTHAAAKNDNATKNPKLLTTFNGAIDTPNKD
jgi:hypothetical protein